MQQLDQRQSPLFGLPQEIRDEIYEHYARDDQGFFYDYASSKLRCKIAADEMQDVAMRANTVTFFPARSENDGAECHSLRSKAGRFERLLQASRRMKMHILHHVAKAGCVTDRMVDQVAARYPSIERYYRAAVTALKGGGFYRYDLKHMYAVDYAFRWQMSAAFCDAIHYTLELASSYPVFEDLASEACSTPFGRQGCPLPFIPKSYSDILNWKPDWWLIPTEDDLALERLLTDPSVTDQNGYRAPPEPLAPVAWYFSATAVAVHFLERLSPNTRRQIREKFIISENMKGVAYPECHTKGLIPFCRENPKLHLEVRVGFWTNLLPSIWLNCPSFYSISDNIEVPMMLRGFADWIDEMVSLARYGMPANAITAIIEGDTEDALKVWTVIKHAASLQEDLAASHYVRDSDGINFTSIDDGEGNPLSIKGFEGRFLMPSDLPPGFPSAIREIIAGTGLIKFDGEADEHHPNGLLPNWEPYGAIDFSDVISSTKVAPTRQDWSPQDFLNEWLKLVSGLIRLPHGGVPAISEKYELQALRYRTQPWVWKVPDGGEPFKYRPTHPELQWADV